MSRPILLIEDTVPKRSVLLRLCEKAWHFYTFALGSLPLAEIDVIPGEKSGVEHTPQGGRITVRQDAKTLAMLAAILTLWLESELRYRKYVPKNKQIWPSLSHFGLLLVLDSVDRGAAVIERMVRRAGDREAGNLRPKTLEFQRGLLAYIGVSLTKYSAQEVLLGKDHATCQRASKEFSREASGEKMQDLVCKALVHQKELLTAFEANNWPPQALGPCSWTNRPLLAAIRKMQGPRTFGFGASEPLTIQQEDLTEEE